MPSERNTSTCLGGSQRNKHKNLLKNLVTQRQQKVQTWKTPNATTSNMENINLPKLMEHLGDIASKYDHLRYVNMPTLDDLQVTVIIGHNINLISPIRVEQGPSSAPSASIFKLGLFLDIIQYWMTTKQNIQCIIMLCVASIASNKTMTLTKKFLIGGKQRQYRCNPKAKRMIPSFC